MKLQLNEKTLNAYINEAIKEEMGEGLGWSRAAKNAAAGGYKWNPNLSGRQNRWYRKAQKTALDNSEMTVAGPAKYSPDFNQRNLDDILAARHEREAENARKEALGIRKNPLPISVDLFQRMFNNSPALVKALGKKIAVDGIWGRETERAYQIYVKNGGNLQNHKLQQYAPGPDGPVAMNEETLNAYINEAINEEIDELFGSRVRKQSQRMITGKGWGNGRRDSTNGWGAAANSDISATDAESDTPQTLVGMITKMERGLQTIEQAAGINSPAGNLAATVTGAGGVKNSLLAAINALTQIANRLNKVERMSGSNAIMESAGDYMDAAVAGNAAVGNARNMSQLGALQKTAKAASSAQSVVGRGVSPELRNATKLLNDTITAYSNALVKNGQQLKKGGTIIGNSPAQIMAHYNNNGTFDLTRFMKSANNLNATLKDPTLAQKLNQVDKMVSNYPGIKSVKLNALYNDAVMANNSAKSAMATSNIGRNTGFWGKQVANMKNGAQTAKGGLQTIKGAKNAANVANATSKVGKVTKTAGNIIKGAGQVAKGFGQVSQLALTILTIADEAARQAAQGRQRNIVRTYNAAAVLARRMGNILQDISDQTGGGQEQEVVTEINVSRGKRSFDSIEQGMQALSQEMRRIGGATQGSTVNGQDRVFNIPQGIDLNTPEGVKAFQEWVNTIQDANGNALITDNDGQPLVPDGKWGPKTNAVYDKIAQMIRQSGPVNESLVTERRDIETALANLERAAGATGSGGNAYSSISAMSGGADASRLQNAQNIKNIIRTYPPVLNQYLNVLADAGAEVSGIQPLNVDTRPHRNYSIKELKAIDSRIQELLQIAQNTQAPEGEEGERQGGNLIIRGTLPPKPVRRPNPNPTPQPTEPEESKRDFNRDFGLERITPGDNLTAQAETDSYLEYSPFDNDPYKLKSYGIIPNNKSGRITKREIKEKIKTAEAEGKLTHDQATELLRNLRMDYKNGVGQVYQNSDGSMATTTRTADKRARDLGLQTSKIEQPAWVNENKKTRKNKLNERQFKRLVKQIIRESLR